MKLYFRSLKNGPVRNNYSVQKMLGAIKLPIFIVLWSLSLVVVVANLRSADAAMMAVNFASWGEKEIPSYEESLSVNLTAALKDSELVTGDWQPSVKNITVSANTLPSKNVVADANSDSLEDSVKTHLVAKQEVEIPKTERQEHVTKRINYSIHNGTSAETNEIVRSPTGYLSEATEHIASQPVRVSKRPVDKLAKTKSQARQFMELGQHALAYELLRTDLAVAREDKEYLGLTAVAAIRGGRMLDASILYERLTELQPEEARWWAGLGVCQESLGLVATSSFLKAQNIAESGSVLDEYSSFRILSPT